MAVTEDGANAAQLRHEIDQGRTGDKVRHLDLAAAPLGTDEEAGGAQLSPAVIAAERERERRIGLQAEGQGFHEAAASPRAPEARRSFGWPLLVLGVLIAAALLFLLLRGFV